MDKQLLKIINSFEGKKALVIGDVMLDRYIKGMVSRVSPEAPIPVVNASEKNFNPGGAGNVASNLAQLGASVTIIGVTGDDEARDILINEMEKFWIRPLLVVDNTRPTVQKTRLVGKNQQILRLDHEINDKINPITEKKVIKAINRLVKQADVVVVSDYDKGTITNALAKEIIKASKKEKKPIIVDAKPNNIHFYKNSSLITLNKEEASIVSGFDIKDDNDLELVGTRLTKELNTNLIITKGSKGMVVFSKNKAPIKIVGKKVEVFDISGAGDTVTSALALSIAAGASLEDSAFIANHAASVVITKPGISTVTRDEILSLLRSEISEYLRESMRVKQSVLDTQINKIEKIARIIIAAYQNKNKILTFGNGGSAADAQHLAAELVGRFKLERQGLPAIALTTDTSVITALSNDYGYDNIFDRQIEALGIKGDVAIGLTTSGESPNILKGMQKAKQLGLTTIGLTGEGGKLKDMVDVCIDVPSKNSPRIQETHITIIHILCELLERELFKNQ